MTRVLLTGGSGFIALHTLSVLLSRGHSVVTTVRSQAKADKIKALYPDTPASQLSFAIVEDVAAPAAFDKAIISTPPFEAVIHTASPFHFNITDIQTQLLDPAVKGTTSILESIAAHAPTVKRVVITSSFAAIIDPSKDPRPEYKYSEKDWNPMTHAEALANPSAGYRASKTFAERAAWDFIREKKPSFTLATMNPPLVFGPIYPSMQSLSSLNTSNQRVYAIANGDARDEIPQLTTYLWVDVRDLALGHVLAMEKVEAGGSRFFFTAGGFTNRDIAGVLREARPDLIDKLPREDTPGGGLPEGGAYSFDNRRSVEVLGIKFRSLGECMKDTVSSFDQAEL